MIVVLIALLGVMLSGQVLIGPPPPLLPHTNKIAIISMVRNEEAILQRMIDSVRKTLPNAFIFLCDTGSTDGTLDIIRNISSNAKWISYEWENFETSRNKCKQWALTIIPEEYEFVLFVDADQELEKAHILQTPIVYDTNIVQIRSSDPNLTHNSLLLLVRRNVTSQCKYRLWTHEFLECPPTLTHGYYGGFQLVHHRDGSSYDVKHQRDIALLEAWLYKVGTLELVPRALFHLAQAHHALQHADEAIKIYKRHLDMESFSNYKFQSRLHIAKLLLWKNRPYAEVREAFIDSIAEHDGVFRQEPYYHLARLSRQVGRINECIMYGSAGLGAPPVDHSRKPLFLDTSIYNWKLAMEHAHCIMLSGRKKEAKLLYEEIIGRPLMKNTEAREWILSEIKNL